MSTTERARPAPAGGRGLVPGRHRGAGLRPAGAAGVYIGVLSGLSTVVQLRAPAAYRGRVLGLYLVALGVGYPVGSLIQGPVADRIGIGWTTTATAGLLALMMAVAAARLPDVRRALFGADPAPRPGLTPRPAPTPASRPGLGPRPAPTPASRPGLGPTADLAPGPAPGAPAGDGTPAPPAPLRIVAR